MGRKKLEIKKIQSLKARQVCFSKRQAGRPFVFDSSSSTSVDSFLDLYLEKQRNPLSFSNQDETPTREKTPLEEEEEKEDDAELRDLKWLLDIDYDALTHDQLEFYQSRVEKMQQQVRRRREELANCQEKFRGDGGFHQNLEVGVHQNPLSSSIGDVHRMIIEDSGVMEMIDNTSVSSSLPPPELNPEVEVHQNPLSESNGVVHSMMNEDSAEIEMINGNLILFVHDCSERGVPSSTSLPPQGPKFEDRGGDGDGIPPSAESNLEFHRDPIGDVHRKDGEEIEMINNNLISFVHDDFGTGVPSSTSIPQTPEPNQALFSNGEDDEASDIGHLRCFCGNHDGNHFSFLDCLRENEDWLASIDDEEIVMIDNADMFCLVHDQFPIISTN